MAEVLGTKGASENAEYDLMKYKLAGDALGLALWDIVIMDSSGHAGPDALFTWSPELRVMLGHADGKRRTEPYSSWTARLHPDDRERAMGAFDAHLSDRSGKTPFDIECRFSTADGKYRWFHAFGTSARDKEGSPLRVAGALRKLTEKARVRQITENILDAIDSYIYLTDIETDEIIFVNRKLAADFGFGESVIGEKCWRLFASGMKGRCPGCQKNALAKRPGEAIAWESRSSVCGKYLYNIDRIIELPNGRKVHMQQCIDITEGKRMHEVILNRDKMLEALNGAAIVLLSQNEENHEKTMVEGTRLIADIAGIDRISLFRNSRQPDGLYASQIYRWHKGADALPPLEELVGKPYDKFIPHWPDILASGKCLNGPARLMPDSGFLERFGCLSVLAIPVMDDGSFESFVLFEDRHVERDFTADEVEILRSAGLLLFLAAMRNENAKELMDITAKAESESKAKSMFLSGMSHEMRTPLNAIVGMTTIGLRASEAGRKDYAFEKIQEASGHLLGIISDILDISKIEAEKLELSPVEFCLEDMLKKVFAVIAHRISEKKQRFSVSIGSDVPRFVVGDDQRLAQIVTNLLSNATKFTPEGGEILLGVSLSGKERGTEKLKIEVTDTGIGITDEQRERLFNPFTQADIGVSREFGGTGLGLAISKRLVEMMDGRIWVESEPGRGSRFGFTAKILGSEKSLRSQLVPDAAWESRVMEENGEFAGKTLLLAEDIAINREIVLALLEETGIQIECAADGGEALDMIGRAPEKYDIVLMDIQMPVLDGLDATRRIRAMPEPRCKEIPIIAMTANVFKEDIESCLAAGMNAHIGKPIDLDDMMEKLGRYLRARIT